MPNAMMPDTTMLEATMPNATMPNATMPDATMPDATMPNVTIPDVMMWHRRLAHLHSAALRSLVNGIRVSHNREQCDVCVQAKHKQRFIRTMVKRVTKPFELVHSDICGNGQGEYDNKLFRLLLVGAGTFEPCPPYARHKNGVAERMIDVITEKVRSMMIDAQVPVGFWGEAVYTAAHLHRRPPNNGLIQRDDRDGYKAPYDTPFEMLHAYEKPHHDSEGNKISYKAPLHHLR